MAASSEAGVLERPAIKEKKPKSASALRRVFTSTNTSASSLTAMISASPAKQVQLRSRMV